MKDSGICHRRIFVEYICRDFWTHSKRISSMKAISVETESVSDWLIYLKHLTRSSSRENVLKKRLAFVNDFLTSLSVIIQTVHNWDTKGSLSGLPSLGVIFIVFFVTATWELQNSPFVGLEYGDDRAIWKPGSPHISGIKSFRPTLPDEIFYWGFCFLNRAFS
jgi:hypothetical protein